MISFVDGLSWIFAMLLCDSERKKLIRQRREARRRAKPKE